MRGLTDRIAGRALCLLAFAALLWPEPAWASGRVALVVGNGGYAPDNIPALANPVNDAKLMAGALETNGFEVRLVTDADQAAMRDAIEAFGERLERAGGDAVGLFYYAGHGVEVRGRNYLIPIGAEIGRAVEFQTDAVPAEWVLSWMEAAGNRLNMVILDACRNNPFGEHRGGSQGLAQMDAPSGTLIAYSAAPGQVAVDGQGENSPYTAALAQALAEPGLKVEDVFKRVRVAVETATNARQTPWESSSLRGDFYFVAKADEPPDPKPSPTPATGTVIPELTVQQLAARAYEAAERVHTIGGYRLVVEQFPDTLYAGLAMQQLEKLQGTRTQTTPSPEDIAAIEAALDLNRYDRRLVQTGLALTGFDPGPADGLFGRGTRKAIGRWQASQGLAETGYLDADTAGKLLEAGKAVLQPFGHNWIVVKNQPCQIYNGSPKPGETATWSGACVNGMGSGQGRTVWRGSYGEEVFQGSRRNGKAQGRGSYTWSSGNRYEGEWRDGKRHGRGVYTRVDGGRYEGEYRDGKRHGRGVRTWANGNRYEGEWRDGKPHGRGGATFGGSGEGYEGLWRKGCFLGGQKVWIYTTREACGFE